MLVLRRRGSQDLLELRRRQRDSGVDARLPPNHRRCSCLGVLLDAGEKDAAVRRGEHTAAASNVLGAVRVVASDHDRAHVAALELLDGSGGVGLELVAEEQQRAKRQAALHLLTRQLRDLRVSDPVGQPLAREAKDVAALERARGRPLGVVGGKAGPVAPACDRLGRALAEHVEPAGGGVAHHHRHCHRRVRELEAAQHAQHLHLRLRLRGAGGGNATLDGVGACELPARSTKHLDLHLQPHEPIAQRAHRMASGHGTHHRLGNDAVLVVRGRGGRFK